LHIPLAEVVPFGGKSPTLGLPPWELASLATAPQAEPAL